MGELRGLALPEHRARLSAFFNNVGPHSAIGVFGSLALPAWHNTNHDQHRESCETSLREVIGGRSMAKIHVAIEREANHQGHFLGTTASGSAPHRGIMPHLWRMRDAFEAMALHEATHGIAYERVLCMRTDLKLPSMPANWLVNPNLTLAADAVYLQNDQIFLGLREPMEALSGAWSEGVRRGFGAMPRPGLLPLNWSRVLDSEWTTTCSNFAACLDLPLALGFSRNLSLRAPAYHVRHFRRRVRDGSLARLSPSAVPLSATAVGCPWLLNGPPHLWEQDVFLGAAAFLSTSLRLHCLRTVLRTVRIAAGLSEESARNYMVDVLFGVSSEGRERRKRLAC